MSIGTILVIILILILLEDLAGLAAARSMVWAITAAAA